jgi:CheY-like chemotaxis protein
MVVVFASARLAICREGLSQALALQPDVILSDVQMPIMSGDTMVLKMRAMPQLRTVPIVMLTARADEALRLRMVRHVFEGAKSIAAVRGGARVLEQAVLCT